MNNLNKIFWSSKRGGFIVTRNKDIQDILSLDNIFSSKYGLTTNSLVDIDSEVPSPLSAKDGDDHTLDKKRNIKWLNNLLTNESINNIKEIISNKVSSLEKSTNLSTELSEYTAVSTICILLGYENNYENIKILCRNFHNSKTTDEYYKNINEIIAFILQNKCILADSDITQYEWLNIASSIFFGGYASVKSSINNLLLDINKYSIENNKNFINESLRLGFISPYLIRTAQSPFIIDDVTINRNDRVYLLINAANRDVEVWGDDSYFFNQNRSYEKLITFGYGTHKCIGRRIIDIQLDTILQSISKLSKFSIENISYNSNINESSGLYKSIIGRIEHAR